MCNSARLIVIIGQLIVVLVAFSREQELYEGSQCTLENGNPGECKRLPDCEPRLEEVQQGKRSSDSSGRCGFDGFTEIVCCPVYIKEKISRRLADIACEQYDNNMTVINSRVDDLSFHIFGGVEAQSGEFPYMVALGYENNNTDEDPSPVVYDCGGSLISSRHVLTAAHCVNNRNERKPIEVRLGNEDMKSVSASVQRIPVSDSISYPLYKRTTHYHDVAIVKLKHDVLLSDTVRPVCLQTRSLDAMTITPRTALVVVGWGATNYGSEKSSKLLRTPSLSLVDREECSKSYKQFLKLPNGLNENMICAVDANKSRGADACQGDSGGPLLMLTESGDSLIAITSVGQGCGGTTPGVYTTVYSYLDWIEEHVWSDNKKSSSAVTKLEITDV